MESLNNRSPEEGMNLMLQLQAEELTARLAKEIEAHRKASKRASSLENRNKKLRVLIEEMAADLDILAQCWACPDLGQKDRCAKCTNSAVFTEIEGAIQWRGFDKLT